ncbi:MAG TPA: choice-of-anchor Q domain-containing protein [Rudaea sp.]
MSPFLQFPHWRILLRALLMLSLLGAAPCWAAIRCVNTAADLVSAVAEAQGAAEGSVWDIRVRTGTYQLNDDLLFEPDGGHDNKQFSLTGGWNANCTARAIAPGGTIIKGHASTVSTRGTNLTFIGDNARMDIALIRFQDFSVFTVNDKPCNPYEICPDTAAVTIEHSQFFNGEQVTLLIYDARHLVFRNNVVAHLHVLHSLYDDTTSAPFGVLIDNDEDVPQIAFNTFSELECKTTTGAVQMRVKNPATAFHHNIVRSTCPKDIFVASGGGTVAVAPKYNLFSTIGGQYSGNLVSQGNVLSANPGFVDSANGDYHLAAASPAINAGETVPGAVLDGFVMPGDDNDGNARPVGTRFDIGSEESPVSDGPPPVLQVTNTSDADVSGSLRHAIKLANQQVGADSQITFNISGSCPHIIAIAQPLPDVQHSLFIDGYSQPGSHPRGDDNNDPAICIVLAPGASGVTHAFATATGGSDDVNFALSGISFGGSFYAFSQAAVDLPSGTFHSVTGNAFGGFAPGVGVIGSLPLGVRIHGTAKFVTVGGSEEASRNTFGNIGGPAISISDSTSAYHTLSNNAIGYDPDTYQAYPISSNGIEIAGSPNVGIFDNAIVATARAIHVAGATAKNITIRDNFIGLLPGFSSPAFANVDGVFIADGANHVVVGRVASAVINAGTYSNYIANNTTGIVLAANAGLGNVIRGNALGTANANNLAIAIGNGSALMANDHGDTDSGANRLQNYPVLHGISAPQAGAQTLSGVIDTEPNQTLRLDFYVALSCGAKADHAQPGTYAGYVDVDSGASGVAHFSAPVVALGGYLTATATASDGSTSELSDCLRDDVIYRDSLD